jgi:hypothetical protein
MKFQAVHDLSQRIRTINLDGIAERALQANQGEISNLNREQLQQGITSTGGYLPDYSPVSVNMFGKTPGPMTLKETGDYYEGIAPMFQDRSFDLVGTDWKTDMIEKRYGKHGDPIGLTDESIGELGQIILPDVQSELRLKI